MNKINVCALGLVAFISVSLYGMEGIPDDYHTITSFFEKLELNQTNDIFSLLNKHPKLANTLNPDGGPTWYPIHWAVRHNNRPLIAKLISLRASIHSRDTFTGNTPLHLAATLHDNASLIQYLQSHGARVNDVNNLRWTPLANAAEAGHANAVQALLDLGASKKIGRFTPQHLAQLRNHQNVLEILANHSTKKRQKTEPAQSA